MCGHVGIAGKLEVRDEKTIKKMLLYDFFRGPDSTGFAAMRSSDKSVKIAKLASHPVDLFDSKKFQDALSGWNSEVFLGHNRLATKGAVTGENAHPYQYGHITGAHNGTLDKKSWDALNDKLGDKTDVDSQAIIRCIAEFGIEETAPLLEGAWALVWMDSKDGTINFLRNKERTFWYSYSKAFDKVFWASEWPFIDAALRTSETKYELYTTDDNFRFFATKEDWWYKYDLAELKKGSTERPKPRVKELKGKEPKPNVTYSCGVTSDPFGRVVPNPVMGRSVVPFSGNSGTTNTSTTSPSSESSRVAWNDKVVDILHLVGTPTQPLAGYILQNEFREITKHGCSFCRAPIEYGDLGVVIFEQDQTCMCSECSQIDDHNRILVHPRKLANVATA